jgi:DNA polymerase-3 subunit epsilon
VAHPKYCFLDVETTGTNPARHGIIQIGGIICGEKGAKLHELDEYLFDIAPFPSDIIEDEALQVSGVRRDQLSGFMPPHEAHRALTAVFEKHCNKYDKTDKMLFLGFNAPFDYNFLRRWFEKTGDKYFGSWFWHPAVDVMVLAMVKMAPVRHEMGDFKLTTVASKLGVSLEHAHLARDDARATKAIFELVRQ